jgi:hypothetical protein
MLLCDLLNIRRNVNERDIGNGREGNGKRRRVDALFF